MTVGLTNWSMVVLGLIRVSDRLTVRGEPQFLEWFPGCDTGRSRSLEPELARTLARTVDPCHPIVVGLARCRATRKRNLPTDTWTP